MHQSNKEVWPQIKKHLCLWHIHQICLKQACIKSKVTLIPVIVPKMLKHIMYNMDCSDDKEIDIWANNELTKVANVFFLKAFGYYVKLEWLTKAKLYGGR